MTRIISAITIKSARKRASLVTVFALVAMVLCAVPASQAREASPSLAQNRCRHVNTPCVTLDTPAPGAASLSGHAYNIDPSVIKVVVYILTNEWYVQPLIDAPLTDISPDGSWSCDTHPWTSIVVLLVDPSSYQPDATKITNPALDLGILAWTIYPSQRISVKFSGRTWGIKTTGNGAGDQFNEGPNFWSSHPSVVHAAADGLHLRIFKFNHHWLCGEVYLTESLGYGIYTVRIARRLDRLDHNIVAAPLFIYAAPGHELDNEYSGLGGLIAKPNNAQFVVQPYTAPGNIVRYIQPHVARFTTQIEWRSVQVTFRSWKGWSENPAPEDIIDEWKYTKSYIPLPGDERVHINLWLLNGNAPVSGIGNEMVIRSFNFQP